MFFFYLIDTLVPMGWGANLTSLGFSRQGLEPQPCRLKPNEVKLAISGADFSLRE